MDLTFDNAPATPPMDEKSIEEERTLLTLSGESCDVVVMVSRPFSRCERSACESALSGA